MKLSVANIKSKISYADKASQEMIDKAIKENIEIVWNRYEKMQPQCEFGSLGLCCKNCNMGPCRIDPFGNGPKQGICGATVDTIAARNIARMVAGGAAAHSDHGRDIVETLLMASQDEKSAYGIKNEEKLKVMASLYDVETEERDIREVAGDVAKKMFEEFGRQEGEMVMPITAPPKRVKLWKELEIMPRAIDREVVELMHRTHIGVDADYKNIMKQSMRAALSDGWGGSMIATELSDVLFGLPDPLRSTVNLGVFDKDYVNIVVHGHEPTLSEIIALVAMDEKMTKKAQEKGAKGVNIGGICCTANEILMRHGIPVAGNFLQQELAILTGAIELMVVDVQCLMPGLKNVAGYYHTNLVTTSPKAKMPGFQHIEFHENRALEIATQIVEQAIENFPNRKNPEGVYIPSVTERLIAGFSSESVYKFLGGKYRATYRPLNDAIIQGRIRGAAGVVGCVNPNVEYEKLHIEMIKELIKNDVLVVSTGCSAITCAKYGLLQPEAAFKYAGQGLQEVCRAVGIPPVLHLGSCVDNSRILKVLTNVVAEGGLGDDISDLPVAGAAPEWMSEKAVSIGMYFVASGVYTVIGKPLPMMGSVNLYKYLTDEIENDVGGKWAFEEDPIEAAHMMIRHIDKKRKALKLKPMIYEQPFKPEE
ncbi:MAG: carbon-monoxide dehydrogenase catalytic subunit [Spirochaetes bacterium]|nr:MAG: carbon-monoxide dehydrogenase catalytic subunit [Spirochaetota bacterium]RKY01560.1 MAG: carbon-monoxide dehydrogenase catalytic subunit [Spirochaetota bacterium]